MSELHLKNKPRLVGAIAMSAFCMTFSAQAGDSASFKCEEAENYNQKIVCTTPHLAELDQRMTSAYAIVRANTNNDDKLSAAQSAWAVRIRDKCDSTKCLTSAYNDRINSLQRQEANGTKQNDDAAASRQCDHKKGHKTGPRKTATPVGY